MMTNAQTVSMLQHFHKFSTLLKRLFLLHCDDQFIRFLTECVINILEGTVSLISKARFQRFEHTISSVFSARQKGNLKLIRRLLSTNKGIQLLAEVYQPITTHFAHISIANTPRTLFAQFLLFKPVLQRLFLQHCNASFIVYIIDCVLKIIKGTTQLRVPISQVKPFASLARNLAEGRVKAEISLKNKRQLLCSAKGLQFLPIIYQAVSNY